MSIKRPDSRPGVERRRDYFKNRSRRGFGGLKFAGPLLIVCAAIAVLVAMDYWANAGRIYRGVEVGNVALGGKTPEQAERVVRERATGALKQISFSGPSEITRAAEEMGVHYNVEATVRDAYAVGREGGIFERLSERLRAAYGTIIIPPDVDYESGKALAEVEQIASRMNEKPREAEINIYGSAVEVISSREGYDLDVDATMQTVDSAVKDMSGEARIVGEVLRPKYTTGEAERAAGKARAAMDGQLVIVGEGQQWTVSPAAIGSALDVTATEDGNFRVELNRDRMRDNLANVYAAIVQEPIEATYDINGNEVSVNPSQTGKDIRDEKFLDAIENGIFDGQREYEVPVVVDKPELTTEEAEKLKPTDLLASYTTNYLTYDDSPGRIKNLQIASQAIDGMLLAPGETFSFNAFAEPLDYHDTKVIVRGRVDTAEGGGLCQVSSTLYMAANLAGLDVVERHPHYAELPYIRPGFDATVWFGALDMKFKNTSPGYVLLREWVDTETGTVHAAIYGKPSGIEVDMKSEKVAEYKDDKGKPVTKWVTYQTVSKNGEIVYDGVLHKDTYKYLKPAQPEAPYNRRPPN